MIAEYIFHELVLKHSKSLDNLNLAPIKSIFVAVVPEEDENNIETANNEAPQLETILNKSSLRPESPELL